MKNKRLILFKKRMWPYLFVLPFIGLYCTFNLFPIIYSFRLSLTSWEGFGEKVFVGFDNYVRIFTTDPFFFKAVINTVIIFLMATPLTIILALVLANLLFGMGSKSRSLFQTINFLPYITTPVALGLIFAFMFDWQTGFVNSLLELINVLPEDGINWLGSPWLVRIVLAMLIMWKAMGYHIVIYLSGISAISPELYEAAKVDGSSTINTFFKITVPLLKPITIFLVVTDLIGGLQLFDEPVLLMVNGMSSGAVGGPGRSILTAVWYFFDATFRSTSRLGYGSAIGFSLFAVIVVFSIMSFKMSTGKETE